jgi:hypothetical protein
VVIANNVQFLCFGIFFYLVVREGTGGQRSIPEQMPLQAEEPEEGHGTKVQCPLSLNQIFSPNPKIHLLRKLVSRENDHQ